MWLCRTDTNIPGSDSEHFKGGGADSLLRKRAVRREVCAQGAGSFFVFRALLFGVPIQRPSPLQDDPAVLPLLNMIRSRSGGRCGRVSVPVGATLRRGHRPQLFCRGFIRPQHFPPTLHSVFQRKLNPLEVVPTVLENCGHMCGMGIGVSLGLSAEALVDVALSYRYQYFGP